MNYLLPWTSHHFQNGFNRKSLFPEWIQSQNAEVEQFKGSVFKQRIILSPLGLTARFEAVCYNKSYFSNNL